MIQKDQYFTNLSDWVNNATRMLTCHPKYNELFYRAICIDTKGRICYSGKQFMQAEEDEAYPIRWWWPDQVVNELNVKIK